MRQRLRQRVPSAAKRVSKLWMGNPSGVTRTAFFCRAAADGRAGATGSRVVRLDSLGLMVANRAYEDVDTLQGPKESFDDGQVFIAANGGGGGQPLGGLTGPDHVKPIELRLALDRRQAACIA